MADDDGFLLTGESIQRLRADHDLLASMVRSSAGRRTVLYPSSAGHEPTGAIGRATTAVPAASSNLIGAGFKFVRFVLDDSIDPQTVPPTFKEEVDEDGEIIETDGANYSTKLTGNVDAFVQFKRVNGVWVVDYLEDVCPE